MTMTDLELNNCLQMLFPAQQMAPKSAQEVLNLPSFMSKLGQAQRCFGRPFAALDLSVQQAIVMQRAYQLVEILKVNPLWQERLASHSCTAPIDSIEQWQALPLMERDDLHELYMGNRPGLVIGLEHGHFQIIASGGTSGGLPIETVYSINELRDTYALSGAFFDQHILPHYLTGELPKWMITTLTDYEMWSSGSMLGGVLQNIEGANFIHAGPTSEKIFNHMMSYPGPKSFLGMSREIAALAELGEALPLDVRSSFKLAFYGSGILQPMQQTKLKQVYPDLQILSYFASNQAEAIGIGLVPDGPLAAVPGLHLIEIVDNDGRWVKEGEEGELVITRLHAQHAPMLRMKLGDRMRRCPAHQSPTLNTDCFEFAGRSSDIIHLGESHYAAPLVLSKLSQALSELNGFSIEQQSFEVQFQNNRADKVLSLVLSAQQSTAEVLKNSAGTLLDETEIRALFIKALGAALSLFDQTDEQLRALSETSYRFAIEVVEPQSPLLYRTGVNKTPLIKDVF